MFSKAAVGNRLAPEQLSVATFPPSVPLSGPPLASEYSSEKSTVIKR